MGESRVNEDPFGKYNKVIMSLLPLNVFKSNDEGFFALPFPGKPDPKVPKPEGLDTRERVFQTAYRENTCWFYALNRIRPRVGKAGPDSELRDLENRVSELRKAKIRHESTLPAICGQLGTEVGRQALESFDKTLVEQFSRNDFQVLKLTESPEMLEGKPSLIPFLRKFLNDPTSSNMYGFMLKEQYGKRVELTAQFLSSQGQDIKALYEAREFDRDSPTSDRLEANLKASYGEGFFRRFVADKYGLKKATWRPKDGGEALIRTLKENGPMLVGGQLGREVYVDSPIEVVDDFAGRKVWAWKVGAKRIENVIVGHNVVIVGAKKVQDKVNVFFIDPVDPSDPQDLSKQKVYKISFDNLKKYLADVQGRLDPDSPFPYGHHGPFKIA
ncbi:MAG: hypothetical protein KDK62_08355 [Chlamydiia bacterium]|nr:hypothetical protein [Chlamydiia bacterium]